MAATMTSCWNAPRPCSSARSLYVPGMRFRNWKVPSERVVAVRPRGICGPEIETRTPGSGAPDESRATPETEPVVWAKARGARNRRARTHRAQVRYRCMHILLHKKMRGETLESNLGRILRLFEPYEVFESFSATRELPFAAGDENFSGAKPQVVI